MASSDRLVFKASRIVREKISLAGQPYKYSALDEDQQQIRLLTLMRGSKLSKLRVELKTVRLSKDEIPKYEALSYAWGSSDRPFDLSVGEGIVSITRNLARALPYLRYKEKDRILWIDAICVNQNDLVERSKQVDRMADIFSLATRVVVWLGEEEADSTLALSTLEMLDSRIEPDWSKYTMKPKLEKESERHWADPFAQLPLIDKEWISIDNLLGRSWFHRREFIFIVIL